VLSELLMLSTEELDDTIDHEQNLEEMLKNGSPGVRKVSVILMD
jgi:hypothetical protein